MSLPGRAGPFACSHFLHYYYMSTLETQGKKKTSEFEMEVRSLQLFKEVPSRMGVFHSHRKQRKFCMPTKSVSF